MKAKAKTIATTLLISVLLLVGNHIHDNLIYGAISSEKDQVIQSITIRDNSCSTELFNKQLKEVDNYVPLTILNDLNSRGYKIVIISGNLRNYLIEKENIDANMEIAGVAVYHKNKIYINASSSIVVIIHEIGHAFDDRDGSYTSSNSIFTSIYETEKNKLFGSTSYYSSNVKEYFAQSFSMYLKSPDLLKQKAPQTYNYINNRVRSSTINISNPNENTIKTAIVTASVLNVRSSNTTTSQIITTINRGTKVIILQYKNGWYRVSLQNGTTGWVSSRYIKVI